MPETLNGPQTTGRDYRNLSAPTHRIRHDRNVAATVRDGNNTVVNGAQVTFTATNAGILVPTTASTAPNGVATTTVDLAAAGTTVVTATVQSGTGTASGVSGTITFT